MSCSIGEASGARTGRIGLFSLSVLDMTLLSVHEF